MTTEKMLPCPFCGRVDLKIEPDRSEDDNDRVYAFHVYCPDCHASGGNMYPSCWCETPAQAIERWNDRVNGGDTGRSVDMLRRMASSISDNADAMKKVAEYIERLPVIEHDSVIRKEEREKFSPLIAAAQEFLARCEKGEIRSKYTYGKFKEILGSLPDEGTQ